MRQDLHLFIGSQEVEFSADPKILFNYKLTSLENPTIVKNGWSKTLEIPSTQANDAIFSHYWNLQRTQNGVNFNAMTKTDFELYINNTLIQNGYCKLDSVKMSNHTITYQLTLYGGLGDFFYNLSYNQGEIGDEKKTLASLQYVTSTVTVEPELNFYINKDTVKQAWDTVMGTGTQYDKWKVLNFAPCYNGIPSNFDADKVLINNRGNNAGIFHRNEEGHTPMYNGVSNASGYSLGQLQEELTCDESFDYRSYLQRPVVNVKRVLEACFAPVNNGGWQVKLDTHFFDEVNNPYWADSWLTLPMLRDIEVEGGQSTEITGATVQNTNKNRKNIVFNAGSLSQIDNVRIKINVGLNASDISGSTSTLYSNYHYHSNATTANENYVKDFYSNDGAVFMLVGRDTNGVICAKSKAYCLSSDRNNVTNDTPIWAGFKAAGYPQPDEIEFIQGKWRKINGTWRFCNMAGNQVDIEFTFPGSAPISTLEICTQANNSEKTVFKGLFYHEKQEYTRPDISFASMWPTQELTNNNSTTYAQVLSQNFTTNYTYNITSFYAVATDYEALFSNTYIPKDRLLSTSFTPASFLIDYCKTFGLYFFNNPAEVADDPITCPKGVIHIMDRNTFFLDEYINIDDRIDHSKTMTITPTLAGSKWYTFEHTPIDSDAGEAYKKTYSYSYGRQILDTGYNFDSNTTALYDSSVLKSGCMVREKDKYFAMPVNGVPVYAYNGMSYSLFSATTDGLDTVELEVPRKTLNKIDINNLGLKGYDCMPKLQCHTDGNSASDGDGVLLFYRGYVQTPNDYYITDDVLEMQTLNGGNACWLMPASCLDAGGNQIAIATNFLPHFTRDLINFGLQEGNIVNSWNFGHPQVVFSPNTYTTDGDSIYDKCWKAYCSDLYNVDNKKLTCYVNLKGIPSNSSLRYWWWFDNCIWRLNEIKDFNAADPSSTLCEFVKVLDVDNYKLNKITKSGNEMIILNSNTIGHSGGTITGQVILQSGGNWFSTDSDGVITGVDQQGNTYYKSHALSPYTGHGETTNITVTIPASSASTPITWSICIEDDYDNVICTSVTQEGDTSPYIDFESSSKDQTFSVSGGTYVLYYTAQNIVADSVSVSSNVSWCSATSINTSTKAITLTVNPSTMPYQRSGALTINALGINGAVVNNQTNIYQQGGSVDVWPSSIHFDYNSASGATINVQTSISWTATINDNNGE